MVEEDLLKQHAVWPGVKLVGDEALLEQQYLFLPWIVVWPDVAVHDDGPVLYVLGPYCDDGADGGHDEVGIERDHCGGETLVWLVGILN